MVEVSDVVAVPSPAGAKKKRRFSLRLDDGTLIRSTPDGRVESLSPEEAYRRGFLSEEHLLHTQALLCEAHAKLPDEGPLRSISNMSKRSADTLLEVCERARCGRGAGRRRAGARALGQGAGGRPGAAWRGGGSRPRDRAPLRDPSGGRWGEGGGDPGRAARRRAEGERLTRGVVGRRHARRGRSCARQAAPGGNRRAA